jgi:ATP-dependent RNA helicase RhlE
VKTENLSFEQILNHPLVLEGLQKNLGFESPTPIQIAVAPAVLEGRNLFAGAKTGSGKTIAFLAPLAERLLKNELKKVIILAPTRELALQIDEEAAKLLEGQNDVVPAVFYGGVPIEPQILVLKHHRPRIFICTPGRVLDLVEEGLIPLMDIEVCVLDEADRMCDMGFAPQVTQIFELLTGLKQTLLFSATLPKELSEMMNRFCPDPVRVQVDAADKSSETIRHEAILCNRREKIQRLSRLLQAQDVTALVFTRTRNGADSLHRSLKRELRNISILHAGYSMGERERTIRAFREGEIRILIATDVVSRGIDVDKITHVIHFDIPDSLEDYIHRSGRSGRAGRAGHTIAFFEKDNRDQMAKFQEFKKKIFFEPLADQVEGPKVERRPQPRDRGPKTHAPRRQARRLPERAPQRKHAPKVEAPTKAPSLISKTKTLLKKIFKKS